LEAEAFLLGMWKNFEELENSISMNELNLIIKHKRRQEHEQRVFAAGLKGIDLEKGSSNPVQDKIDEVKRRAEVALRGEKAVQQEEFAELGFGYESA
jgi:hypothetical protein